MAKSFSHPRILPQRGGLRLSDQQRKAATIWYNWYAGGGAPHLALGEGVVEFSGAETLAGLIAGGSVLYQPRSLWYNGKTYHCYQGIYQEEGLGQIYLLIYDENDGVKKPYRIGSVQQLTSGGQPDSHTVPSFQIDNDGNLYFFQERTHDTPIDIYKAADFNFAELLSEKINPGSVNDPEAQSSYHHIIKRPNGNAVSLCRMTKLFETYSGGHLAFVEANNGMEGWGDLVRITTNPRPITTAPGSETDRTRHYPHLPMYRYKIGGYYYIMMTQRVDNYVTGLGIWNKYYLLKTQDFRTFENFSGSFSQDISEGNYLTETILTNYQYYDSGGEGNNSFIPMATIGSNGTFYCVTGDENSGDLLFHYNIPGEEQITKSLNIPDIVVFDPGTQQVNAVKHIAQVGDYIELVVLIDEGSVNKPHLFRSTDLGDTWTDFGDMIPEIESTVSIVKFPDNYLDIPANRNFLMAFYENDSVTANTRKMYLKRASRGRLKTETPKIIVPSTSYSDAFNLFHYRCTDDAIIRSGNDVSTLIDQFGLRNATGINNPQWNGSDAVQLNGTDNYFSISPVGLTELTKLTLFAVVRTVGNKGTIVLSLSNNSVTNQFIMFQSYSTSLGNESAAVLLNPSSNTLRESGQLNAISGDDQYHLYVFVVDGRCKVDMYIDGEKQFYRSVGYSTLQHYSQRGTLGIGGTINAVRIGSRAISSGDQFLPMVMKEMILKHNVYDYATQRAIEKKLADDNGITLNYGYQ